MNKVTWGLTAGCAAGLLVHVPAHGATTHYTDRATFEAAAAAGGVKRFDFETSSGFAAAPASISPFDGGRVSVLSTRGNSDVLIPATLQVHPAGTANQVLTGVTASPGLSRERLFFELDSPVFGVAFDVFVGIADDF